MKEQVKELNEILVEKIEKLEYSKKTIAGLSDVKLKDIYKLYNLELSDILKLERISKVLGIELILNIKQK